jgi:hypothetical protein
MKLFRTKFLKNLYFQLGLFVISGSTSAANLSDHWFESVEVSAKQAQVQCFMKIHFDTFAFEDCIEVLAKSARHDSPRRLGIYYFGYVGAMDSVRTGMYGSKNTAWLFLKQFRKIQKKLNIDDASLCASIPGDCEIRISQMKLMEKGVKPILEDRDGVFPSGQHIH